MHQPLALFLVPVLCVAAVAQIDDRWFNDVAAAPANTLQAGPPVVDPVTGNLVLVRSDMSVWSWNGQSLAQIAAGVPPARWGAMIAPIDTGGVRGFVCFGGCDATTVHGDTWLFAGGQWTAIDPTVSPPARSFGAAAGRRGKPMLTAGTTLRNPGGGDTGVWILPCMSDTWELELTPAGTFTWTPRAVNGVVPPARAGGVMCSDGAGRVVLCGGGSPVATLQDAWVYAETTDEWIQVPGPAPISISGQMAFDTLRGIGVLTAYRPTGSQTWHFDFATGTWTLAAPAIGLAPSQFTNIGYLGYDAARAETVYVDRVHGLSVLSIADAANVGAQPASCARALGLTLVAQTGGPRISGGGYALGVTGTTAGAIAVLAAGDGPLATPVPIGPGCLAFFGNIWELRFQVAAAPTVFSIAVTNAPALIGVRIDHQVVEIDPSSGAFTAVSNDLRVVLGR